VLKYPTIGLGSCGSNWSFHSLHTKLVFITYVAHNSTHSALIKEHKSKELANGNPHFAAGSLGGRNSKDLGDSSFSSRAGGDFDISSEYEALAKSRRAQLVQYADRRARNEYET